MPSLNKILHFAGSLLITAVGVGLLGFGMSGDWAKARLECASKGTDFYNGTADISLGLFLIFVSKNSCPNFGATDSDATLDKLKEIGGSPIILHSLVLAFLVFSLIASACTIIITFYNSVSNPYQTYLGPMGVYACSTGSVVFSILALIMFLVNIFATNVWEEIILTEVSVDLRNTTVFVQLGFYLLIPFLATSHLAILLITLYQYMTYTYKKEQQRPTEDAPKEIMMY